MSKKELKIENTPLYVPRAYDFTDSDSYLYVGRSVVLEALVILRKSVSDAIEQRRYITLCTGFNYALHIAFYERGYTVNSNDSLNLTRYIVSYAFELLGDYKPSPHNNFKSIWKGKYFNQFGVSAYWWNMQLVIDEDSSVDELERFETIMNEKLEYVNLFIAALKRQSIKLKITF